MPAPVPTHAQVRCFISERHCPEDPGEAVPLEIKMNEFLLTIPVSKFITAIMNATPVQSNGQYIGIVVYET